MHLQTKTSPKDFGRSNRAEEEEEEEGERQVQQRSCANKRMQKRAKVLATA